MEYFFTFEGKYYTKKRGYRIHWIYSSEKRKRDRLSREDRLKKAEQKLSELSLKINKRNLKTKKAIHAAAIELLEAQKVENFFHLEVGQIRERDYVQIGRGRPGLHTKYKTRINTIYTLSWSRNINALKEEARLDGVFPLLCTDATLSANIAVFR